ncbi:chromosome partition protein Smc [bacterium MnTg03]|nr:chromosome partition protein Smc [bacterium MnTg03]
MQANFAPIGQLQTSHSGDNSFWPSFTDIMIVITMIFLMATSLLVVRNWQLVAELRESIVAEQLAAQIIESTSQENVTLEERLANVEQSNSILRLRLLKKDEELLVASNTIQQQAASIRALEASNTEFGNTLDLANAALTVANLEIERVATQYRDLENQVARLSAQLNQQAVENEKTRALLSTAKAEIESLTQTSQAQQQEISSLTREKQRLSQEIASLTQDRQRQDEEIASLTQDRQRQDEEIAGLTRENQRLSQEIASLTQDKQRLAQESQAYSRELLIFKDESRALLSSARAEIDLLSRSSQTQQQSITSLKQDKLFLKREVESYNRQLLALKGQYEVVKSKYEELVKPARSAKGKYIVQVYYIKGKSGKIIRYKQPGDSGFTDLPLAEVEKRLSRLKAQKGKDLYVQIIIPENSGLTYNEAWDFMRKMLVKYDYYYQ